MNCQQTFLVLAAVTLAAFGCASAPEPVATYPYLALGTHRLRVSSDVLECRARLEDDAVRPGQALDARNIGLLSWNVKKGSRSRWKDDLIDLAVGKDLILIQEATLGPEFTDPLPGMPHWAFSPGFQTSNQQTGVMTISRIPPRVHCNLSNREPWLKTPKATLITEFDLSDTDETLLVVNIHAINFTLRLDTFRQQMDQIRLVSEDHSGPMILSGDFNTWGDGRNVVVLALVDALELQRVTFDDDNRTRVFGRALDHVFVRGLRPRSTATHEVQTSDHNPLSAELTM